MKRILLTLLALFAANSFLNAQNPKILFKTADLSTIKNRYNSESGLFPFNGFKTIIGDQTLVSKTIVSGDGMADVDRGKADLAKKLAFRYYIENGAPTNIGDRAFYWLYTKYVADNYIYETNDYARWMTNGLALIDYCIAYDLLAGSGYFEAQGKTTEKTAIKNFLKAKADSLYVRCNTQRTVQDFLNQGFGQSCIEKTVLDIKELGIHWTAKVCYPTLIDRVNQERLFRSQIGNMRIIVASALGVAGCLFSGEHANATGWLTFGRNDLEHFLLARKKYLDVPNGSDPYVVQTQNIEGAFPEGIEYLNYSGEGFIPFMIANKLNGGEDYFQDANFKKIMDWCYDVQLPTGGAPQFNSSGYTGIYPIEALSASAISSSPHYLWHLYNYSVLKGSLNNNGTVGLPVEGYCLLNNPSSSPAQKPFDLLTNKSAQGQVVIRNTAASPNLYLAVAAENGSARYAAETHGHADAASFILSAGDKVLVRHPGYSGHANSELYERSTAHNTINPVVANAIQYDATVRLFGLPPTADATIYDTKTTSNFVYTGVATNIISMKSYKDLIEELGNNAFVSLLFNEDVKSLKFDYVSSRYMRNLGGEKQGETMRHFVMVNNKYMVLRDDITKRNEAMQYAVSFIHGNNGDYEENHWFDNFATNGNESRWFNEWLDGEGTQLRVNTFALGGKVDAYSTPEKAPHQDPIDRKKTKYHAAVRTGCNFINTNGYYYGQILSVLEVDQNPTTLASTVTKRNSDTDPYLLSTVDGRGKTYGRYDVIFSKLYIGFQTITLADLPYPIKTDASYLIMSFSGSDFTNVNDIKIFSFGASFINYGNHTFIPSEGEVAQTTFQIQKINTSNNLAAISTGSQRKVVRTTDGGLHAVFESMGHVWYEYSFDEGNTWKFGNDGRSLDLYFGKSPSISAYDNTIAIVFQEWDLSTSDIKLLWFGSNNPAVSKYDNSCRTLTYTTLEFNTLNLQPVVSIDSHGPRFLCVWKESDGLYFYDGHINPFYQEIGPYKITNTNSYSNNPTIAYSSAGDGKKHIAWDENNQIYYTYGGGSTLASAGLIKNNISTGCGYNYNYQPSIIAWHDNSARVSWIGKRYEGPVQQFAKSVFDGYWKYSTVFTGNSNGGGPFWTFGNDVNSTNMNLSSGPIGYIVAWSKSNGVNEYTRNSSLGGSIKTFASAGSTIYGKDVQVVPGTSFDNMYGMILNTQSTPYRMIRSDNINILGKEGTITEIYTGRQGVVYKDRAQFYFVLGDVSVDNEMIEFEEKPDSIHIKNKITLNRYLITKPFTLTNNSNFLYSVQFGFTDSSSAVEVLKGGEKVTFVVQLIEEKTNKIIGQFDDVIFNTNNVFQYNKTGYKVNTDGIDKKSVRLQLIVNATFDANFSLVQSYNSESVVGMDKDGRNFKQIRFRGLLAVTQYELSQNYPNPFNPTTTISYAIPQDGMVTLKIYDALGREVKTLVNEFKTTGRYTAEFDASTLSSGVYIYKLVSDKYSSVKKMLLVK